MAVNLKSYSNPESSIAQVNEAISAYVTQTGSFHVNASVSTLKAFFQNKMLVVSAIAQGVPFTLFKFIQQLAPFTEVQWANYLSVSTKTLQRSAQTKGFVFKPIHSEKILEMAEVLQYGNEVFDTPEQFASWLNAPVLALGNVTPFSLLQNSYGKELVMAELHRINHGIFA